MPLQAGSIGKRLHGDSRGRWSHGGLLWISAYIMFSQCWLVTTRTDSGLCSQCQPYPSAFFWKKRSHKISIGSSKTDNKRNGNRERLLLPSFERINTMAPEKHKEEVWLCQKTSFVLQDCCVMFVRRAEAAQLMCESISRYSFPLAEESILISPWQKDSLILKAAGWHVSCWEIWQLRWSGRDFGIGSCPTGEQFHPAAWPERVLKRDPFSGHTYEKGHPGGGKGKW